MKSILTILLIAFCVSVYPQRPILKMLFENNAVDSSMYSVAGSTSGSIAYSSTYKAQGNYSFYPGYLGQWESTNNFNSGTDFYVSAWVRTSTSEDNRTIIGNYPEGGADGWYLALNGSANSVYFHTVGGSLLNSVITGTNAWEDNTWNNIGVWVDRTRGVARIYINGVKQTLASNDSLIRTDFPYNTAHISINGYLNGGQSFFNDGYIDNVQVYNYLPVQSQIDSLVSHVNDVPAFELGIGGTTPSGYSPIAGRHVRLYKGGIERKPKADLYFKRIYAYDEGILPVVDSITILLAENFETFNTAIIRDKDSLGKLLPITLHNYDPAEHTIVNVGSNNQNTWQMLMPENEVQGLQFLIHLGDTATELYYQHDLYAQSNFNAVAKNGYQSGKMPGGFFTGNDLNGSDTITKAGIGGWVHNVWGPNLMPYVYDQLHDAYACGACGQWEIPRGYWITKTIRVNVGTPGNDDGFAEIYINGVLDAQLTGLKFRSITQGVDFGKIESIYNSYQFGGGDAYLSPQDQYIRLDNLVVYRLNSTANSYITGLASAGRTIPLINIETKHIIPDFKLTDETYTNVADTIYDIGQEYGDLIHNPPNKVESIYKTVSLPSGNISFQFLTAEFSGWSGDVPYHVIVHEGDKNGTVVYTFGRNGVGTVPSGTYTITNNIVTFEIIVGNEAYYKRGVAIKYWQP